ncbi:DUF2927 domain-containing protein [Algicella marina]|uniref:DUF2927 domain-containing protein n=1 Tax=Algicella marina TaxID=2683284 RepID=UPI001379EFF0|nr:DUF2927 domain-containing protein [Algicella marina]
MDDVAFAAASLPRGVTRSNTLLAEDFLDLTFALESGQQLPGLLRYEGPVRVSMPSPRLAAYRPDLENLLARLRSEAGIDIRSTTNPLAAQLHIEGVPAAEIQRAFPGAACFIIPGVTSWNQFRGSRGRVRWSDQTTLGQTGIFVPTDSTPQDIRDCLHEEIGQALGPANDIYRLPDSVFNDDNFHAILTSFDMLMLRTLYDPALRSGMPRSAAARVVPQVLDRINPAGRGVGNQPRSPESLEWKQQIEAAMTRRNSRKARVAAADRAVWLAGQMKPVDHRLGTALVTRGRLTFRSRPEQAAVDFANAYQLLSSRLGAGDIRTAQAALHLAILGLKRGDFPQALSLARNAKPAARRGQNAVLLSGLLAVEAQAQFGMGDKSKARATRIDSLKWARYAFGDINGTIQREQAELELIGEIAPPTPVDLPR